MDNRPSSTIKPGVFEPSQTSMIKARLVFALPRLVPVLRPENTSHNTTFKPGPRARFFRKLSALRMNVVPYAYGAHKKWYPSWARLARFFLSQLSESHVQRFQ